MAGLVSIIEINKLNTLTPLPSEIRNFDKNEGILRYSNKPPAITVAPPKTANAIKKDPIIKDIDYGISPSSVIDIKISIRDPADPCAPIININIPAIIAEKPFLLRVWTSLSPNI